MTRTYGVHIGSVGNTAWAQTIVDRLGPSDSVAAVAAGFQTRSDALGIRDSAVTASSGGIIARDDFNRADDVSSLGTAVVGGAWTNVEGSLGIIDHLAYPVVTGQVPALHPEALLPVTTPMTQGSFAVDIYFSAGNANMGVLVRATDANTHAAVSLICSSTQNALRVGKRVAGTFTSLASALAGGLVQGRGYSLQVVLTSTVLEVWVDGVRQISYLWTAQDTADLPGRRIGLTSYDQPTTDEDGGSRWDNMLVTSTATFTPQLPARPFQPVATVLGASSVRLTWPTAGNGGSPLTGYEITANPSSPVFSEDFATLPQGAAWSDGTTHGQWYAQYAGFGTVQVELDSGNAILSEIPTAPTGASDTHACLVTTTQTFGDIDLTVRQRTLAQTRTPTPNPWEVAWLLWNYTDDDHFYYIVLKTNGWELGKEDPAYPGSQRYLADDTTPTYPINVWRTIRVTQAANVITVWVDGAQLVTFTDNERPYTSGSIGLYCEDSHVHHDDVVVASQTRTFTGINPGTTTFDATNLQSVPQTFNLTAINALGQRTSYASAEVTPTAAVVPGVPTSVNAMARNGGATVNWATPASDGGSPIIDYQITVSPGLTTRTVTSSGAMVSGLTNGTSYTFTVKARNAVGLSAASAPSNTVVPTAVGFIYAGANYIPLVGGEPAEFSPYAGLTRVTYWQHMDADLRTAAGYPNDATHNPLQKLTHTYDSALPATYSASNASAYRPTANVDVMVCNFKPGVLATANGSMSTAIANFIRSFPTGDGTQYYLICHHEPENDTGYTSADWRECQAVWAQLVIANRGTRSMYPTTCLMGWTFNSASGRNPVDWDPKSNYAAHGIDWRNEIVFAGDCYGNAARTVGVMQSTTQLVFDYAKGSGYTRYALGECGIQSYANGVALGAAVTTEVHNYFNFLSGYGGVEFMAWFAGPGGLPDMRPDPLCPGLYVEFAQLCLNGAVVVQSVPDAPTAVNAVAGNGNATISWTAPASDGGSPILDYQITSSPGSLTRTVAASGSIFTGLTNQTTYTFTVKARNAVGLSAASAPSNSVTPAGVTAPPGYTNLVLYDDFSGTTLDSTKWNTYYAERPATQQREDWGNGQRQYYLASNVTVSSGYCHLTYRRQNYTSPATGHTYDWTAGMIESKYDFRFGWFEARIKLPLIGPGFWPAWWTWANPSENVSGSGIGGEMDVFEFYSDNHQRQYVTLQGGGGTIVSNADWTADWHVYSCDWRSDRTRFYIDGTLVLDVASNTAYTGNMLLLLTAQVADDGTLTGVYRAPAPTGATTSPQDMLVDYVAVWKP